MQLACSKLLGCLPHQLPRGGNNAERKKKKLKLRHSYIKTVRAAKGKTFSIPRNLKVFQKPIDA